MPQLDQFTYFTQFFWSCLVLFSYYIPICNDRDGVLGIGRILKLRNQLLSHRGNKIRSNDLPQKDKCSEVSIKGFSCGVSYMSSTLFEVSQWCKELAVDLLGKRRKRSFISSFGEISCSRAMEINLIYLISKSSEGTSTSEGSRLFTCRNDIMLIHVPQGQKASPRGWDGSTNNKYSSNNDWWLEFHQMMVLTVALPTIPWQMRALPRPVPATGITVLLRTYPLHTVFPNPRQHPESVGL